jgi:biopolymer transport protein ExbB/TolQ
MDMELFTTIIAFFQDGGAFMYPIAVVMALGLAIALERYIYLSAARGSNRKVWKTLMEALTRRDYQNALDNARRSKSAIGKILAYGLERSRTASKREEIETAMEEGLMEVMPRLEQRTHYLAILANVATLLGLLGTIIGLIQAFTAVASANPAEKADMLSASISVAMNTTAFGLIVAIPLLLIHTLLQTKTTQLVDSLEMAAVKFLNILSEPARTAQSSVPLATQAASAAATVSGGTPARRAAS